MFLISYFLPAVHFHGDEKSMPGWNCAWVCATLPFGKDEHWNGGTLYYFLFTVPNLVMLLSPIVLIGGAEKKAMGWTLAGFAFASILYIISYWIIGVVNKDLPCRIGYYLWLASFITLFAAIRCRMRAAISP
jgi:hypothetical protein